MKYTSPVPSFQDLSKFYSDDYYVKSQIMEIFYKLRKKKVKRETGRILDIGCGSAGFLKAMAGAGWEAYGVEKSEAGYNLASADGNIKVFHGELIEQKFTDGYFDVVTIWQVLEHMESPVDALMEVNRILKDEGVLIVSLPNIDSLQFRIFGKNWFHLDMPRHLYHFSPRSIKEILNKCNFEIYKVEHFSVEYNIFGYIQSFLNMAGFEFNLFHNVMKGRRREGGRLELLGAVLLASVIAPVSVFLSLIEAMSKRGGIITVFSKKVES